MVPGRNFLVKICLAVFCFVLFYSCATKVRAPVKSKKSASSSSQFIWPLDKFQISSFYGWRSSRRMHYGIDLRAPGGTPIKASRAGKVIYAGWMRGYGRTLIIRHNRQWTTLYGHLKTYRVRKGRRVKAGQIIAGVGRSGRATGNHLHFEIRRGSDAVDPLSLLPKYSSRKK